MKVLDEQIIARYQSGEESIAVIQAPNGKYFNYYGYDEVNGSFASAAGGFSDFNEAEEALHRHRPTAVEIERKKDFMQDSAPVRKTVVVNLFAGPGAGKTTCAWEIASELKKRGIEAEYVSEYAKEFVWDGRTDVLDGSLEHQQMLFKEQSHRINRLLGKVDVVVTDSPTVLGLLYLKEPNSDFEAEVLRDFHGHKNFNLFIQRGQVFQQAGRIHNAAESVAIDKGVQVLLQSHNIYYGTYYHSTVGVLVNNIVTHLNKINQAVCPTQQIAGDVQSETSAQSTEIPETQTLDAGKSVVKMQMMGM